MLGIPALLALARRGLSLVSLIPGAGILSAVIDFFSSLIRFFSTPFGQKVGIVLIGIGLFFAGDIYGARKEKAYYVAKIEQMQAQAESERASRDQVIKQAVAAEAGQRMISIQKAADAANERADVYARELATRKDAPVCKLNDADIKRLRKL